MKTLPVVVACSALAIGCATSLPVEAPPPVSPVTMGAGEWRTADRIFVITDASGTMYQNETFPSAKAMTQAFIASLPDRNARAEHPSTYEVGAIGFGGMDRDAVALSNFDRAALETQADSLHVMGSVDGTGGTTPIHGVIAEVAAQIGGTPGRTAVVVISDGLADDPELALASGAALVDSVPSKVCFYGIQVGHDPEGTAFLNALSGLTDCGFVRNADSLKSSSQFAQFTTAVVASASPPAELPPVAAGPCEGTMRLRGIEFGFDKANIDEGSKVVLDYAADQLRKCPNLRIHVDGYTDSTGPEAYNMGLSERRADAAEEYFVEKGIPASRLEVRGFGEADPVDSNATREGRARNRRVELKPIQ
jgi:outer membrane protein OmpA-like peptidoglycan-associated protein